MQTRNSYAQVCVLMLDGRQPPHKQDMAIARHVKWGRALVIAVNMWDAVEDKQVALSKYTIALKSRAFAACQSFQSQGCMARILINYSEPYYPFSASGIRGFQLAV